MSVEPVFTCSGTSTNRRTDSRIGDRFNNGGDVSRKKPPPKADEYSAFKNVLNKVAKVPKAEADEQETKYQRERKKRRAG